MADKNHCPFCNVEVDEDLIVFGGTCPQCFGEIPGEEAATDPGEEVKAKQHALDAKRLRRRMLVPVVMAFTMGLTIITTALALIFWPTPPMAILDLDDAQYADVSLDFITADPVPDPKATAKTTNKGSGSSKGTSKPRHAGIGDLKIDAGGLGGDIADVDMGQAGPRGDGPRAGSRGSQAGDVGLDAAPSSLGDGRVGGGNDLFGEGFGGAKVERNRGTGVTLTDDNAIISMVQRVMRDELRKLKSCYNQQLKADENLQGAWVLNFTVARAGTTKEVSIAPKGEANPALEQCMATKMNAWQFQPIKADLPVRKTVTFRPS